MSTALTFDFGTHSCCTYHWCAAAQVALLLRTLGEQYRVNTKGVTDMNTEASRQTLTSASSTSSTVDKPRLRRANDTPVKHRPESSERIIATPNSARHVRPWRGVTPSHNSKPDVTLVSQNLYAA